MRLSLPLHAFVFAAFAATSAVAQDIRKPKDRTVRGPIAAGDQAGFRSIPSLVAPVHTLPGSGGKPATRQITSESGLGALHARNRFGTSYTCIGDDCANVVPTPISPQDRAFLMRNGVQAGPPGDPLFHKPPPPASN